LKTTLKVRDFPGANVAGAAPSSMVKASGFLVAGRNDADVHGLLLIASDRTDHASLNDVQQFRLQGHRQIIDVIQENRALIGGSKKPLAIR
jgi:hypothetical protein